MPAPEPISECEAVAADSPVTWLGEHGDYLYSYALSRIGDAHVAEDLVQETLLAAMQSRDGFDNRASLRTWLTSILRNKIVDHWRKSKRTERAAGVSADDDASDERLERFADSQFDKRGKWRVLPGRWGKSAGDPGEQLDSEEFRAALRSCLEGLPPRPAEVIDLVERRGMSLAEMSNILGVSATNAGVLLHRARLALRRCLELNWFRDH